MTASNSAGYIDSAGIYVDVVTVPTVAEITANNPGKNLFGFFFSTNDQKDVIIKVRYKNNGRKFCI